MVIHYAGYNYKPTRVDCAGFNPLRKWLFRSVHRLEYRIDVDKLRNRIIILVEQLHWVSFASFTNNLARCPQLYNIAVPIRPTTTTPYHPTNDAPTTDTLSNVKL